VTESHIVNSPVLTASNFPNYGVYLNKQLFSVRVKTQNDEINRGFHAHSMQQWEEMLKTIGEPTGQKIGAKS
jgi:L-rhamnose mutarotase